MTVRRPGAAESILTVGGRAGQVGLDHSWTENADTDEVGQLVAQHVGQAEQGVLGGGVERRPRVGHPEAVLRAGIENMRLGTLLHETASERRAAIPTPHEVDLEHPPSVALIDMNGPMDRRKDTSVVDSDVDVSETLPREIGQRLHRGAVGDIQIHSNAVDTLSGQPTDGCADRLRASPSGAANL
jgi:hypothetical protein